MPATAKIGILLTALPALDEPDPPFHARPLGVRPGRTT
jgi:hypothetical protein